MNRKRVLAMLMSIGLAVGAVPVTAFAQESAEASGSPAIVNLKTEGLTDPLGLDEEEPSFSWQMQSEAIGAAQKSYQIVVTDDEGTTVWDSGLVESSASNDIKYEGDALQPTTAYTWQVTVTDNQDNTLVSEPATFETAFMDTTTESWDGAQMIGAPDLQLDAASQCAFNISADVQVPEGSTSASFIMGAGDFRLENAVFNTESMAGENYVRIELDISDVEGSGAKLYAYRVGYTAGDDPDTPVFTIEEDEGLNERITAANKNEAHRLDINVSGSTIVLSVDGEAVGDKFAMNPLGDSSSYNSFPNLNSIGFAARAGETAVFTDYKVTNTGRFAQGELFGENTGASYGIFEGMDGVTVEGNTITVDGGERRDDLLRCDGTGQYRRDPVSAGRRDDHSLRGRDCDGRGRAQWHLHTAAGAGSGNLSF